jgi:hypothetical protein
MDGTVNLRWLGIFVGVPCDERTQLHSAADLGIGAQPLEIADVVASGQPRRSDRRFGRSWGAALLTSARCWSRHPFGP